jgi:transcriptional regulator with XRE-family HTH domain
MRQSTFSQENFHVGTSRGTRSIPTLAVQVAIGLDKQREVGARIRELRGPRPQPVIADAIGVTLRAYHAWEAGESGIAWRNLQKLAEFFDVSENYLLYGAEEVKGPEGQLDRIEGMLREIRDILTVPPADSYPQPEGELARRISGDHSSDQDRRVAPRRRAGDARASSHG